MSELETLKMINARYERRQLPKVLTFSSAGVSIEEEHYPVYSLDKPASVPPYIRKLFTEPLPKKDIQIMATFLGYKFKLHTPDPPDITGRKIWDAE